MCQNLDQALSLQIWENLYPQSMCVLVTQTLNDSKAYKDTICLLYIYSLSTFFVYLFNDHYCSNFRNATVKKTKAYPWASILVNVRAMRDVCPPTLTPTPPNKMLSGDRKGSSNSAWMQLRMRESILDEKIYPDREEVQGLGIGILVVIKSLILTFLKQKLLFCEVTHFLCTDGVTNTTFTLKKQDSDCVNNFWKWGSSLI